MQDVSNTSRPFSTDLFAAGLGLLGLLLAGALTPRLAQAQTPTTTIQNGNADTRLQLNYDGGLYVPGTYGPTTPADSIPATGSGTRLMWYPAKAAFRTGRVGVFKDGTQWDASKVGEYSAAFGIDTKASGFVATAMGIATTASGASATAMGEGTAAATTASLSIGQFNSANASSDGTLFVVGNGSGSSSRSDALVLDSDGNMTTAGKIETESTGLELPDGTVLSGNEDLGVPTNSNGAFDLSNGDGVVAYGTFGSGSIPTSGTGTRMMWYPGKAAFRAGRLGAVSGRTGEWDDANIGDYSAAFGQDAEASGESAVAMGRGTTASGAHSLAMGNLAEASGLEAVAFGRVTEAATGQSLTIGKYNDANTSADGTLFVAGNGLADSPSDALVLDESGTLTISGSLNENSDRRLKTQIEPLGSAILKKLGELRPVRFEFRNQKTHPSGAQIGLIAQDVRKEFPTLVGEGSGGYLSLAYPKMTAVLVKGLQEQQTQLEKKQAQIDSLEEKVRQIQDVKKRLSALETGRSSSAIAGLAGSGTGLLLAFLLGGLLGAGLLWRRRD